MEALWEEKRGLYSISNQYTIWTYKKKNHVNVVFNRLHIIRLTEKSKREKVREKRERVFSVTLTSGSASARVSASGTHLFPAKFKISVVASDLPIPPTCWRLWPRILRRKGSARTVLHSAAKQLFWRHGEGWWRLREVADGFWVQWLFPGSRGSLSSSTADFCLRETVAPLALSSPALVSERRLLRQYRPLRSCLRFFLFL